MIDEFFECYSSKRLGFSFVSRTRECPVESRVIAVRVARVHGNWGRVLCVTRETANEQREVVVARVFALELDNHGVEGGPCSARLRSRITVIIISQSRGTNRAAKVSNVNSCGTWD